MRNIISSRQAFNEPWIILKSSCVSLSNRVCDVYRWFSLLPVSDGRSHYGVVSHKVSSSDRSDHDCGWVFRFTADILTLFEKMIELFTLMNWHECFTNRKIVRSENIFLNISSKLLKVSSFLISVFQRLMVCRIGEWITALHLFVH